METTLTPEVAPGPDFYYAVLLDEAGQIVSHCHHHHKTREAAEKCSTTWMFREFVGPRKYGIKVAPERNPW